MKMFRQFLLIGLAIIALSWFSNSRVWKKSKALYFPKKEKSKGLSKESLLKLEQKAAAAKLFVKRKGYNEDVCILIDMSLPSGQNRLFIYNLKKDSIATAALVAHGNCFEYWMEGRRYSNAIGSGCTSLGKYKIGNSYTGKFGYSYKLYGLDSSNNNAFVRTVVLHSHSCIPENEVEKEICQSNGCPTVSPLLLGELKHIINDSRKPILLWIYN